MVILPYSLVPHISAVRVVGRQGDGDVWQVLKGDDFSSGGCRVSDAWES
jgi:hypothetical protein